LIVEVVERPEVDAGPAAFWGLVLNVDDIDAACERIGSDRIGAPKDAVQPGRRIATINESAGLGLPVALMTT
jgi:predicted enzyme related to lactoylglutathione lyase